MNELMDELFDYYQETQPMEEEEKKVMKFKAKYEYQQFDFLANKIVKHFFLKFKYSLQALIW